MKNDYPRSLAYAYAYRKLFKETTLNPWGQGVSYVFLGFTMYICPVGSMSIKKPNGS